MKFPPALALARLMSPLAARLMSPPDWSRPEGSALALIAPLDRMRSGPPAMTSSRFSCTAPMEAVLRVGVWPAVIVSAPVDRMISPPSP